MHRRLSCPPEKKSVMSYRASGDRPSQLSWIHCSPKKRPWPNQQNHPQNRDDHLYHHRGNHFNYRHHRVYLHQLKQQPGQWSTIFQRRSIKPEYHFRIPAGLSEKHTRRADWPNHLATKRRPFKQQNQNFRLHKKHPGWLSRWLDRGRWAAAPL